MEIDKNSLYSFKAQDGSEHLSMYDVKTANKTYWEQNYPKKEKSSMQDISSEKEDIIKLLKNEKKLELKALFEVINMNQFRVSEWKNAYQKLMEAILFHLLTASEVVAFAKILRNASVEIYTDQENELYLNCLENLNIIINKLNSEHEQKRK